MILLKIIDYVRDFVFAKSALAAGVDLNFLGGPVPTNPADAVNKFYGFALAIGGLLAFGAIVWGGIRYTFAAGNPSGQTEGKEWIKSALWGLILLGGAYLILNTINPKLTTLALPELQKAEEMPNAIKNGLITDNNGFVYCGGVANAACQDPKKTCVNQGSTVAPNYQCVDKPPGTPTESSCGGASPAGYKCGAAPRYACGECPAGTSCMNKGTDGNPPHPYWACGN